MQVTGQEGSTALATKIDSGNPEQIKETKANEEQIKQADPKQAEQNSQNATELAKPKEEQLKETIKAKEVTVERIDDKDQKPAETIFLGMPNKNKPRSVQELSPLKTISGLSPKFEKLTNQKLAPFNLPTETLNSFNTLAGLLANTNTDKLNKDISDAGSEAGLLLLMPLIAIPLMGIEALFNSDKVEKFKEIKRQMEPVVNFMKAKVDASQLESKFNSTAERIFSEVKRDISNEYGDDKPRQRDIYRFIHHKINNAIDETKLQAKRSQSTEELINNAIQYEALNKLSTEISNNSGFFTSQKIETNINDYINNLQFNPINKLKQFTFAKLNTEKVTTEAISEKDKNELVSDIAKRATQTLLGIRRFELAEDFGNVKNLKYVPFKDKVKNVLKETKEAVNKFVGKVFGSKHAHHAEKILNQAKDVIGVDAYVNAISNTQKKLKVHTDKLQSTVKDLTDPGNRDKALGYASKALTMLSGKLDEQAKDFAAKKAEPKALAMAS